MKCNMNIGKSLALLSCLAVDTVLAGRFSDVAAAKGFHPSLKERASENAQHARRQSSGNDTGSDGFRFLTNATKQYQVESLPDIPFDLGEMYSGSIPIDESDPSRNLFFVYQPTVGAPVDEVTIWFNGGPGCSSLEAFFQENGRFIWGWGMYAPQINPYSWVNLTNVLWVEQPVGTGFSTGNVTATTQEETAADFVNFFRNFQDTFGIKNFKIYVTGESYAGRYVPYISAAMLDQNDTEYFDVAGALAYDPVIGSFLYSQQEAVAVPFVLENNNIINLNASFVAQLEALHESCGYAEYLDTYLTFPPPGIQPPKFFNSSSEADHACDVWESIFYAGFAPNPCWNVYEITTQCPMPSDPLGDPTEILYLYSGFDTPYFNRTDVKKAMHAPDIDWVQCGGPVFIGEGGPEGEGDLSLDPIQSVLPQVIEATNRVLIANGALDMEIITNGTLVSIQNMTWGGALGFQTKPSTPIVITLPDLLYGPSFAANGLEGLTDHQGEMGVQHFERGLMWAETYLSGHMQPQFQPRSSYRHLQWVLGHIDTL